MIWGLLQLAHAQVHQLKIVEVGTGVPVVATIRYGPDETCTSETQSIFYCDFTSLKNEDVIIIDAINHQNVELRKRNC